MWIARDGDNSLHLFSDRPKKFPGKEIWILNGAPNVFETLIGTVGFIEISDWLFPEVTFENSPKELVINETRTNKRVSNRTNRYGGSFGSCIARHK